MDDRPRDPGLAAVFSFFVTGAGQIYAGRVWLGFVWFLVEVGIVAGGLYLYWQRFGWNLTRAASSFLAVWLATLLLSKLLAVQHAELACARGNTRRERARLREALRSSRMSREARPWVMIPETAPVAATRDTRERESEDRPDGD
ncbi:MAG: hypothetical protein IMX00_09390 [Limnochordales bacterium]|nr:hypothetical protein [Limnochordales bacterium]